MKRILHRLLSLFCLGIAAFGLTFACSRGSDRNIGLPISPEPCRIVQHVRGEACIPLHPERIVTLDFNSLAATLALDIKPIATWITTEIEDDFRYFHGKTDGIEILRSSTGQPNLEKLVSMHPDLIIVISHSGFEDIYKYLPQIAPTVVLPWIETRGNWKIHLRETARVFEKMTIADKLIATYYQRTQQLKQDLSDRHSSLRLSFAFVASGQLVMTRQKSFAGSVLNDIGVLNPIFGESGDYDLTISEELLPEIDSDALFIAPLRKDDHTVINRLQQKPLWSKLKAVQNNQVHLVDFSVWRGLNIFAANEVLNDLEKYLINTSKGKSG